MDIRRLTLRRLIRSIKYRTTKFIATKLPFVLAKSRRSQLASAQFVEENIYNKFNRSIDDVKLIAFYLPQFYPFPENDKWWGKGFTEWTNVTKAVPQYEGHYQPHLPIDLGFYDLRLLENVKRQIELAEDYGIYGFCYYYYWFSGYKIMDMPIYRLLQRPELDFPFCISWANEPWSAIWDEGNREVLVNQDKIFDAERFFNDISPLLLDPRYIKVEGKPILIIYHPQYFECKHFKTQMETLKNLAVKNRLKGLYIIFMKRETDPQYKASDYGGDGFVEFPPLSVKHFFLFENLKKITSEFNGNIYDLRKIVDFYKKTPQSIDELTYRSVLPMWDNTARKAKTGCTIFENASPELYAEWLSFVVEKTKKEKRSEHQFVFINAWNEWSEGAHLEPDRKYGYAFLEATKRALLEARKK